MTRGLAWETAFITLWVNDNNLPTDRTQAIAECARRADDVVAALREARVLPPVVRVDTPDVIPPEAIDVIPPPLLPSLRSYYRLWRAVAIEPGNVDYYQDQLIRALGGLPNPSEGVGMAMKRLLYMDMTAENLEGIENAIFGLRLSKDGVLEAS